MGGRRYRIPVRVGATASPPFEEPRMTWLSRTGGDFDAKPKTLSASRVGGRVSGGQGGDDVPGLND